jgi:hypothetical protein
MKGFSQGTTMPLFIFCLLQFIVKTKNASSIIFCGGPYFEMLQKDNRSPISFDKKIILIQIACLTFRVVEVVSFTSVQLFL